MNLEMKNAVIFHGTGDNPNSFWLPWAKNELEKRGYSVSVPQLPNSEEADLSKWLPVALTENFTEDTLIIGHSAGCPLILSVLENINLRVKKAILVSGFAAPLPDGPLRILQEKYDWKKIKGNVGEIVFINSDNDPWGCDDKQGKNMFDHLGGTLVIRHGEGHMGSEKFNQPYKEFPFLMKFVD